MVLLQMPPTVQNLWFESKRGNLNVGKVLVGGGSKADIVDLRDLDSFMFHGPVSEGSTLCFFRIKSFASMRVDSKEGGQKEGVMLVYDCWCTCQYLRDDNRIVCIKAAGCQCKSGNDLGHCSHVGELVSLLVRLTSSTSQAQAWGKTKQAAAVDNFQGWRPLSSYFHTAMARPETAKNKDSMQRGRKADPKKPKKAPTASKRRKKAPPSEGSAAEVAPAAPPVSEPVKWECDTFKYDVLDPRLLNRCAFYFERTRRNLPENRHTTAAEIQVEGRADYRQELEKVRRELGPVLVARESLKTPDVESSESDAGYSSSD
jgi:hypothetical protein